MNIAVFGAKGRVGSKVVEIAKKRGHTVICIDVKDKIATSDGQTGEFVNLPSSNTEKIGNCLEICSKQAPNEACEVENASNPQSLSVKTCNREKNDCYVEKIDAVIDFSTAAATQDVCDFCRLHNCALISGVTGRNEAQQDLIDKLSKDLPVVCKANFSVGVAILHRICEIVAKELADWDCEIVEIHRKGKIDAPSGTAKSLAATVAQQKSFKKVTIHALRCGSNFGKHEIVFATSGESLTFTHQAENVEIFALGAIVQAEKLTK